jgi:hypothetical protein
MATISLNFGKAIDPTAPVTICDITSNFTYTIDDKSSDYTYVLLHHSTDTIHYLAYNTTIIFPYLQLVNPGIYSFLVFNSTNLEVLSKLKQYYPLQEKARMGFMRNLKRKDLGKLVGRQSFYLQTKLNSWLTKIPPDIFRQICLNLSVKHLLFLAQSDIRFKELLISSNFMIPYIQHWLNSDLTIAKTLYANKFKQFLYMETIMTIFSSVISKNRIDVEDFTELCAYPRLMDRIDQKVLTNFIDDTGYNQECMNKLIPYLTQETLLNYMSGKWVRAEVVERFFIKSMSLNTLRSLINQYIIKKDLNRFNLAIEYLPESLRTGYKDKMAFRLTPQVSTM